MPKKTRREKILAEQRRKAPAPGRSFAPATTQSTTLAPGTFSFQASPHISSERVEKPDTQELSVIQHDLTKTIILAAIAIGLELGAYWMLHGK
ncbi:MAG TPA: hypothetical protein VMR81_08075 [Patescibacteria group bacterium]|nr:hypothetical protein [Patescibacteria group bacterium]